MAAKGRRKRTGAARASDGVWPPPPTYETPKQAPQRRLLLPLYMALPRMPEGFGLPKWAKTASFNIMLVLAVFWLERDAPLVGKIMVGFFSVLIFICLFALLYWASAAALLFVSRSLGRPAESLPSEWLKDSFIPAMGGRMGLVPNAMFLIWGLSYLDIYHFHRINLVALIVWGSWFLLGCIVAVVNGVGQWLRERRIVSGNR